MDRITAVIFDFGQVLGTVRDKVCVNNMLKLTGLNEDEFHKRYRGYRAEYDKGLINGREYWGKVISGNTEENTISNVLAGKLINEDIMCWLRINETMLLWVKKLKEEGIKTAILSNMPVELCKYIYDTYGWVKIFDSIVFSSEVGFAKPESEIYKYCINSLAIDSDKGLFIDDDKKNIEGAQKTGLKTFLFTPGITKPEEIADRFGIPG